MPHRSPITVRLESFEGPLDLLLFLIQSHELDISTISIGRITDQYLAYVRLMRDLDFDLASEFLVMASTLLQWKSKSLLPQENKEDGAAVAEDEELTQEELVRQLLEHRRFRAAGATLAELPWLGDDVFARPNPRAAIERTWKKMDTSHLVTSYQDILVRARKRVKVLRKETVSLSEKILEFRDRLTPGEMKELHSLLETGAGRPEVVVTFLAALELSRMKKMRLHQEMTFGPILLELLESLRDIDVTAAIGFDALRAPVETNAKAGVARLDAAAGVEANV